MLRTNHSPLYFLTGLSIFFGVFIIVSFYVLEISHMEKSAIAVLNDAMKSNEDSHRILPEVFMVHTEQISGENLPDAELKMVSYYLDNKVGIPFETIQKFKYDGYCFYFAPTKEKIPEFEEYDSEKGDLLLFVNVSFEYDLLKTTTLILTFAMVVIALLLYFVAGQVAKVINDQERSLKCFFENASHELKTPLMGIRGYADGMIKGLVSKEKGCEIIVKETERMSSLVEDILKISKVDSGMAVPIKNTNDVREIIYDAICVIGPVVQQKNLGLVLQLPEPLMAQCDEDMMFSAVSNILANSTRYANSTIRIEAAKKDDMLIIEISDDGTALSEQDKKHIFDRFYKGIKGQSGIGMALAQEYIHLHQGTILLERTDKTMFRIGLPVTSK